MITDPEILAGLVCPYCGQETEHVSDTEIYKQSYGGMMYLCRDCDAYVGCHKPRPTEALGRVANKELREAKIQAHAYFDNLWERKMAQGLNKYHARNKAYKWLAGEMGIDRKFCHIGMFDVAECMECVRICRPYYKQ